MSHLDSFINRRTRHIEWMDIDMNPHIEQQRHHTSTEQQMDTVWCCILALQAKQMQIQQMLMHEGVMSSTARHAPRPTRCPFT